MMLQRRGDAVAEQAAIGEPLATRLRRLRLEQGRSLVDTAIAAGVSEGAIRQLESGNVRSPSFLVGLRLANYLHVDPFYLAMGDGATLTEHLDLLDRRVARLERFDARITAVEQKIGLRR